MGIFSLGTAVGTIELDVSQLQQASSAATQAGFVLGAIGSAATAGFGQAISVAADFEQSLDHVSAVTNATTEELNAISDAALQMGETTVFSANEAANSFVELAKAGFSAQEIISGVGIAAAQLAAAGDLPLTQSTDILASTLRTFQLEAKDAVKVADELSGAANASLINVDDLGVSLRYVGGIANALGVPLNDVAQALAILGNSSIKGSTAGTSLRRILIELNPTTRKQVDLLRELGIITGDAASTTSELESAQHDLKGATEGINDAEEKLSDLRAKNDARATDNAERNAQRRADLLENAADREANAQDRVQKATENVGKAQDDLNKVLEKQATSGGAKTSAEVASRAEAVQNAQERIQDALKSEQEARNDAVKSAQKNAKELTRFDNDANKTTRSEAVNQSIAQREAEQKLTKEKEKAAEAQKILNNTVDHSKNLFFDENGKVKSLAEVFAILADKTKGFTQAQKLQTLDVLFGSRAVAAAAFLVRDSGKSFGEIQKEIERSTAAEVAEKKTDNLKGAMKRFRNTLENELIKIAGPLQSASQNVVEFATGALRQFDRLPEGVRVAIGGTVGAVGGIATIGGTLLFLGGTIGRVIRAFKLLTGGIEGTTVAKTALETNVPVLAGRFGFLGGAIRILLAPFKLLKGVLIAAGEALIGFGETLLGLAAANPVVAAIIVIVLILAILIFKSKAVREFLISAGEAIGRFFTRIPGYIGNVLEAVGGFLARLPGIVGRFIGNMVEAVVNFFVELPGRILYWLGFAIGFIIGFGATLVGLAVELGINFLGAIVDFFSKLPGRIGGFLTDTLPKVIEWIGNMIVKAGEAGLGFATKLGEFFIDLPGKVFGWLMDIIPKIAEFGIEFVKKMGEIAIEAVKRFAEEIAKLPEKGLSLIAGVVKDAADFTAKGLRDGQDLIKDGAEVFTSGAEEGANKGLGRHSPSIIERIMKEVVDNTVAELHRGRAEIDNFHETLISTDRFRNSQNFTSGFGLGGGGSAASTAPAGPSVVFNQEIHPSEGMDEVALGQAAINQASWEYAVSHG